MQIFKKSTHIIFALLSILLLTGGAIWVMQRTTPNTSITSAQLQEMTPALSVTMPTDPLPIIALTDTPIVPIINPTSHSESATSKIVFVDLVEIDGRKWIQDIYLVNPNGTELTNLTQGLGLDSFEIRPKWAADGSRIYFSIYGSEQDVSLNAINPDGSGAVKLFDWPHQIMSYDVSPDGNWVVYAAGGCIIFKIGLDGSNLTRLSDEVSGENAPEYQCDGAPDWSPDGSRILFISTRNHNINGNITSDLYTMRPDGSEVTQLTNLKLNFSNARWSPDGQQIAFGATSSDFGLGNLYVMNADGSNLRQLTNSTTEDERAIKVDYGYISWSPDGTRLVVSNDTHQALGLVDVTTGQETYPLIPDADMRNASQPDWSPWLGGVPATPTPTLTPTVELTATATLTPTETPTPVPTDTPTPAPTDTPTPLPTDAPTATPTATPAAETACQFYPIALSAETIAAASPGQPLANLPNGTGPGNFGWLSWNGDNSVPALVTALTPPGASAAYTNPNDANDHSLSVGDWVKGLPGVKNSQQVRQALDSLKAQLITVPVWDQVQGEGNNTQYRVSGYAQVQLTGYDLSGQNRLSLNFLGPADCE